MEATETLGVGQPATPSPWRVTPPPRAPGAHRVSPPAVVFSAPSASGVVAEMIGEALQGLLASIRPLLEPLRRLRECLGLQCETDLAPALRADDQAGVFELELVQAVEGLLRNRCTLMKTIQTAQEMKEIAPKVAKKSASLATPALEISDARTTTRPTWAIHLGRKPVRNARTLIAVVMMTAPIDEKAWKMPLM